MQTVPDPLLAVVCTPPSSTSANVFADGRLPAMHSVFTIICRNYERWRRKSKLNHNKGSLRRVSNEICLIFWLPRSYYHIPFENIILLSGDDVLIDICQVFRGDHNDVGIFCDRSGSLTFLWAGSNIFWRISFVLGDEIWFLKAPFGHQGLFHWSWSGIQVSS